MKVLFLLLTLTATGWAQSEVEVRVLKSIGEMMKQGGGRVTFSDLHNSDQFGPGEKAFLDRLYETFFQVPGFLKTAYERTGRIPTRRELGDHFGISARSAELLLRVAESDPRVPALFQRDAESGEIASLNLALIDVFNKNAGGQVKVTDWEGKALPAFALTTFDGRTLTDKDLGGTNTLIYFWFTGCPPCVRIAPILADLDRRYRSSNFRVVGFNADRILEIDTTDQQRKAYLKKSRSEYTNAHLDQETRRAFGSVNLYPALFFVAADGKIARHLLNYQDESTLVGVIEGMIKE
ncbi:MAG: redoxin domain-containing protein [Acidobacteriota bacterium]